MRPEGHGDVLQLGVKLERMLAAFTMFMVVAGWSVSQYYVGPLSVFASIFVSLLELLVGVLQAFVFTFLTAIFVGLYTEPSH